jgi:hypothetical protein
MGVSNRIIPLRIWCHVALAYLNACSLRRGATLRERPREGRRMQHREGDSEIRRFAEIGSDRSR